VSDSLKKSFLFSKDSLKAQ